MGIPYPQVLRDRVLAAYDRGLPTKQIAELFQLSPAGARRVKQRRRENGETNPRPEGGATVIKVDTTQLRSLVRAQPDATLKELSQRLGVTCGESTLCMALKRMKLSLKKRQPMPKNRSGLTSPLGALSGKYASDAAKRKTGYLSMKRGPRRTWLACAVERLTISRTGIGKRPRSSPRGEPMASVVRRRGMGL